MKPLITYIVGTAILFTTASFAWDETAAQTKLRWEMEAQTKIMQEQLELQKQQMREMQAEQYRLQGQQNRMRGGIDTSAIQNYWLNNQ